MSNPFIIKWTPNRGGGVDFNAGGGTTSGDKTISIINFNNPTLITGCQLWLDATDPLNTGTPPANGSNVTTWYDKSGFNRNAAQFSNNAAYYGTYNSTGFNSKPTINFSSSVTGYSIAIPQSLFNNGSASTGFTIFMIFNYGASGYSYGALYTIGYNNLGDPIDIYGASRVTTIGISGTYPNVTSYTNTTLFSSSCDSTNNGTYSEWYNGGNATNSVAASTTNPTYTSSITGYFRIGQSSSTMYIATRADRATSFIGNISEVIMYNKILTTADRQLIEGYLAWKWGLQTKLPTTHPYYNSMPTIQITSFTPISVIGNILWLDSSDPTNNGDLPSNGSTITSWIDKLNRYIFSQNNSSQKPTYSTNALNGLPTISFSSASSQFLNGGTSFPIGTGSVAFFVVFKTNDGTSGASIFNKSLYGPASSRFLCIRNPNSGMSIFLITSGNATTNADTSTAIETQSTGSVSTSSYTIGNYRILSFIFNRNAATATIYFNGTSIVSSTGLSSTITTFDFTNSYNTLIGGYNNNSGGLPGTSGANQDSLYLNGNIAEILWYKNTYDMDLVTSQKIEGYLAWKWGLQSKLPTTHLYYNSTPTAIVSSIYYLPSDPYLFNSNILLSYSVRLLNSTYNGPVFNIRRSSDNVTQDFYADTLQTYLTTGPGGTGTSFSTWIGANTGYVKIWYDQSGRGNNATNASNNTTQPNISLQNGKYVIQWQNTNSTTINTTTAITPNTIFCQFWNNNSTYGSIFSVSGGQGIRFGGGTSPGLNINGDGNSGDWYYSGSGTKLVYSNNVNLSSTLVLNSLSTWQVFSASTQTPAGFSMNLIGADGYSNTRSLNGYMTEFICHNTQMTASSMTSFYNNKLI